MINLTDPSSATDHVSHILLNMAVCSHNITKYQHSHHHDHMKIHKLIQSLCFGTFWFEEFVVCKSLYVISTQIIFFKLKSMLVCYAENVCTYVCVCFRDQHVKAYGNEMEVLTRNKRTCEK